MPLIQVTYKLSGLVHNKRDMSQFGAQSVNNIKKTNIKEILL